MCRESICHIIDDGTRRLLDELLRYPNVPRDWKSAHASSASLTMPVIPPGFVSEGRILRYFSMMTTVGTPQTIAAQELRVECMFRADQASEACHLQLLATLSKER